MKISGMTRLYVMFLQSRSVATQAIRTTLPIWPNDELCRQKLHLGNLCKRHRRAALVMIHMGGMI